MEIDGEKIGKTLGNQWDMNREINREKREKEENRIN